MKLIIDIGNTSTKLALFNGKEIVRTSTIDECELLKVERFISSDIISSSIISSVKEINAEVSSFSSCYNAIILTDKTKVPLTNKYKTPATLGKDRLAGVIGATFLYPKKDILVLDAGTCLTIDFVNAQKEYIGGRISPGMKMRFKALHTFTDQLPLVHQENIDNYIGDDTDSSIVSGVQQGILSEVKLIISEYRLRNPDTISVVTGGDYFFFEKELKNSIFANPNLVLIGLNEILDYNE